MKCPNCTTDSGDAAECPACGLIFAKWREQIFKALESPTPARVRNPWVSRAIAAVVVAAWMLGLAIYYRRR